MFCRPFDLFRRARHTHTHMGQGRAVQIGPDPVACNLLCRLRVKGVPVGKPISPNDIAKGIGDRTALRRFVQTPTDPAGRTTTAVLTRSGQPFLGGEVQLFCDDQGCAIHKGKVAAINRRAGHCSKSAAVTRAAATSMTLRPWSIAVLRIRV